MDRKRVRLFYTCRNITGKFSGGLLCNLKILESTKSELHFLTDAKTLRGKEYIENDFYLKISKTFGLNQNCNADSWLQVYEMLDVSKFREYEAFHIFGGLHFPQSDITRFSKRCEIFPNDRGQLKFNQVAKHITNILAIHKAHVLYDIPLHEFAYDSDEMCTAQFNIKQNPNKYSLYHIYDIPKYKMNRLNSLQYFFGRTKSNRLDLKREKEIDFTFGYTVFPNSNRTEYIQYINDIGSKFKQKEIYVKNTITGENTSIDRQKYLAKISKSKYTLIIPSYDTYCFSMYRFIEAIYNDCLPIIHPDCRIDDVQRSYDVDLRELMTDTVFTEPRRLELLEYLKKKILPCEMMFRQ